MSFYANIFKLVNMKDTKIFIGGTKQTITKVLSAHKAKYIKYKLLSPYDSKYMFHKYGIDTVHIILIERIKVDSVTEMKKIIFEYQDKNSNRIMTADNIEESTPQSIIINNPTKEKVLDALMNKIKITNPYLQDSSIKTYATCLNYVAFDLLKISDVFTFDIYDQYEKIIKLLKQTDKTPSQRRVYWSSLSAISSESTIYKDEQNKDKQLDEAERNNQEKNDKQREYWVTQEEKQQRYTELKKEYDLIIKNDDISSAEYQQMQLFLIIVLYTKLSGVPRLKEIANLKIRNYKETDNYYDGTYFYFNTFKTVKTEGKQKEAVIQEIKEIINVIKEYNPTDYLLIDFNSNKLTEIKLNQRINQIFNKKVGVNGLRHSHITELYADKPITNLNEVLTNAKNNKHSLKTHLQYIKN